MFRLALACVFATVFMYADDKEEQKDSDDVAPVLFEETQETAQTFADRPAILEPTSAAPPELVKHYKRPWLATSLSALCPGLGHAYLNDYRTAGTLAGAYGLELGMLNLGSKDTEQLTRNFIALQTTQFYGIYAAYRDVRANNQNVGFRYPMPTDSFQQLLFAPFDWTVIRKPEVWGGVLGCLSLAVTVSALTHTEEAPATNAICSDFPVIDPFMAFAIGLGEESFFRGYLQSAFSESLTPVGGMITSSILFAAAHIANAELLPEEERMQYYKVSLPVIGSIGAYCSWLTYKNRSLRESVAVHSWYDFVLLAISSAATKAAITKKKEIAFSFTF